jgi:hypothetical protein
VPASPLDVTGEVGVVGDGGTDVGGAVEGPLVVDVDVEVEVEVEVVDVASGVDGRRWSVA